MLTEFFNDVSHQDSHASQSSGKRDVCEKVEGASLYEQQQKSPLGSSGNKFKGKESGWKLFCRAEPSLRLKKHHP